MLTGVSSPSGWTLEALALFMASIGLSMTLLWLYHPYFLCERGRVDL